MKLQKGVRQKITKNRRIVNLFFEEIKRQNLLQYFDAVVLHGSCVKATQDSNGKDIDLRPFYRAGISDGDANAADAAYEKLMQEFEEKHGVKFDEPWLYEVNRKHDDRDMRWIAGKPHAVLYAAPSSKFLSVKKREIEKRKWLT